MDFLSMLNFSVQNIAVIVPTIIAGFKSIKFVQEGERGIILRFGKALKKDNIPKIIEPGFVFIIPFAEVLQRHHVREQTASLKDQNIIIKDDLVFFINAVIRYKISDIYKALFNIDELDKSIKDFAKGALNDVIKIKNHEELRETKKISKEILDELKEIEKKWGIEMIDVKITSISPDNNSAKILSTAKEISLKAKSLEELVNNKKIPLTVITAIAGAMPTVETKEE